MSLPMPGCMRALPGPPELVLPSEPWLGNLLGPKRWPPALSPTTIPPGLGQKTNVCPCQEGVGGHKSHQGRCKEEALVLPDVASGICLVPALGLFTITEQKLLLAGEMLRLTFSDTLHCGHGRGNLHRGVAHPEHGLGFGPEQEG